MRRRSARSWGGMRGLSLVRRCGGWATRGVGDAGLAEEIAQDIFARLSQNAARLTMHPLLAGWLHRTTMLLALDRLRRRMRLSGRSSTFLP